MIAINPSKKLIPPMTISIKAANPAQPVQAREDSRRIDASLCTVAISAPSFLTPGHGVYPGNDRFSAAGTIPAGLGARGCVRAAVTTHDSSPEASSRGRIILHLGAA